MSRRGQLSEGQLSGGVNCPVPNYLLDLQAESESLAEELKSIKTQKQPPGVFCKKSSRKKFANFATLLKRDSGLCAFLCNLRNFQEHLF